MGRNKQLLINMTAQIVAFVVNFAINFFLTPFILDNVGREAYGFVSLGNNFVNYASLASAALNSMAGRFISIRIQKKDFENAKKYYTSVFVANIVIAVAVSVPAILVVIFLDRIVNIRESLVRDVQILWSGLFINFIVGLIAAAFGALLFAANRIDVQSKRNAESYVIKAVILWGMFSLFIPKVWYIGLATLICGLYAMFMDMHYARKFYPDIRFDLKYFDFGKIKELLASGIWNTVSRVGSLVLTELDLLLSNWLVGSAAMGTLSIAKTVPNYASNFTGTIVTVFMPQLTISYATDSKEKFIREIRKCMKILLFFNSVIFGILFGFTDVFLELWLPDSTTDVGFIYILSVLTILGGFVSSVIQVMFNIFTVTNKLRFSSITILLTGVVSIVLTVAFVKGTNLGLLAIAGVSVICVIIRNIFIILPYGAKCIDMPWYTFFPDLFLNIFDVGVSAAIGILLKTILMRTVTWGTLIGAAIVAVAAIMIFNYFIILKREERKFLLDKLKSKLKR